MEVEEERRFWGSSKKTKRHARDFRMTVNRDFAKHIKLLKDYHETREGGTGSTWATDELLAYLVR